MGRVLYLLGGLACSAIAVGMAFFLPPAVGLLYHVVR